VIACSSVLIANAHFAMHETRGIDGNADDVGRIYKTCLIDGRSAGVMSVSRKRNN